MCANKTAPKANALIWEEIWHVQHSYIEVQVRDDKGAHQRRQAIDGRHVHVREIVVLGVPEARKGHGNQVHHGHVALEERFVVVLNVRCLSVGAKKREWGGERERIGKLWKQ